MTTARHLRYDVLLVALVACCLLSACTLDFEQFQEADVGVDAESDIGADADTSSNDNQNQITIGEVGARCTEDSDCGDGDVCMGEVCLRPCDSDSDCPLATSCFQIGAENYCAPRCRDTKSCDHLEGRDDLSCVYLVETEELGSSPHSLARACLTDSADDGVFDGVDNCLDTANAPQLDSAADGVGDACSPTPRCHVDSSNGVLDFPATNLRAGSFSIPAVIDGQWLPVVGTTDASNSPESSLLLLDRHSGQWHDAGVVEHPGEDRFFIASNRGGFYISPGIRDEEPVGSWTHISPTGGVSYGPPYSDYSGSYEMTRTASAHFPNGDVQHLLFDDTLSGINFYLSSVSTSLGFGSLQMAGSTGMIGDLTDPLDVEYADLGSPQTLRHPDGSTGFAFSFFHEGDLTLPDDAWVVLLIDIVAPRSLPGSWAELVALYIDPADVPDNFDPVFVPAPGGQLYVFDGQTGEAGRFVAQRDEEDALRRTWSDYERIPEYDLSDFDDFDDFSVYLLPDAPGLGIAGRPAGGNEQVLEVREIYFGCHPMTNDLDTTGDGIGDFIDNCPFEDNPDQADLDGDSWGDLCDSDIDGDGIANIDDVIVIEPENGDEEPNGGGDLNDGEPEPEPEPEIIDLSQDSTNNGVDNVDADDTDGDGIVDRYDPFPLDSSNDGTFNRWTNDASGNGFTDTFMRNAELDPYNFYSLPAGKTFAYLTEDAGGHRTLHFGHVDAADEARQIDLPDHINPHQLKFGPDEYTLYFLADAPEQSNRFIVYDADEGEITLEQDIYPDGIFPDYPDLALRSVSMIDEDFVIVHESGDGQTWRVSRVTPGVEAGDNFNRTQIFSQYRYLWFAHWHDDVLAFLGAQTNCRECAGVYRHLDSSGQLEQISATASGVDQITAYGQFVALAAPNPANPWQQRIVFLRNTGATTTGHAVVDEQFDDLSSVGFSRRRNTSGEPSTTQQPMGMATLARHDQTLDLWIYLPQLSPANSRWHLLVADDDPIVEAAWAP